jgi:CheY-like chemotaxis protein
MAMATGQGAWRVLVVDDEENLNWSLVNSLQKEGYVTEGARTGEDALHRMADTSFDCVISDVKMPGMDGFELLQWLRQNRPRTRVIMMTAFGSPTARQEALRSGVIAYMEKPFDLRSLKEELRRLAAADASERADEEGYDLLEVARVLNLSRRDIAVSVQGGGFSGMLRFLRGELVYAEAGLLRGDQAFFAVCTPKGGQVQPMPWDGRTERNVTTPVSRLIFTALAERDNHAAGATMLPGSPGSSMDTQPANAAPAMPPAPPKGAPSAEAAVTPPTPTPVAPTTPDADLPRTATLAGSGKIVEALARLADDIASPCGLALTRTDGTVIAQTWRQTPELSVGVYSHLSAATQAASRALLLGDIGPMREIVVRAGGHTLLVRRVTYADGAALLVAVVPAAADENAIGAVLHAHIASIGEALR